MRLNLLKEGYYVVTTVITVAELFFGKYRRQWQEKRSRKLEELIASLEVIPFLPSHAKEYGQIRASLVKKGLDIGFADAAIAAIAKIEDFPVITGNLRHFERIKDVKIQPYQRETET